MVQPSPVLCARVRFSTKQVGFGFYRGNKTGSVGAHTQYGGYLVDWRKVRNYAVPDLTEFKLTPYVTREIDYKADPVEDKVELSTEQRKDPLMRRAMPFLESWRTSNYEEFTDLLKDQYKQQQEARDVEEGTSAGAGILARTRKSANFVGDRTARYSADSISKGKEYATADLIQRQTAHQTHIPNTAMKNTPKEHRMSRVEKQERSVVKELRKYVKKTAERRQDEMKRQIARGGVHGAVRVAAYQEASRERARRMVEKLAA